MYEPRAFTEYTTRQLLHALMLRKELLFCLFIVDKQMIDHVDSILYSSECFSWQHEHPGQVDQSTT